MKGWRFESYRHALAARGIKTCDEDCRRYDPRSDSCPGVEFKVTPSKERYEKEGAEACPVFKAYGKKKMDLSLKKFDIMVENMLTEREYKEIEKLSTPQDINDYIVKNEARLARNRNKRLGENWGEYLTCDEVTELMSSILENRSIPFVVMIGINDRGDSHSWIMVGKKMYDPTGQGYHWGQRAYSWIPGIGGTEYPVIEPDFDSEDEEMEKAFWKNVEYID